MKATLKNYTTAAAMGAAMLVNPAQAAESKIATLDINKITSDSKAAKNINEQIEKLRKQFESSVKEFESKLQKDEKTLVEQQASLTPEAFEKKRSEFEAKVGALQASVMENQQKIGTAAQTAMESVRKEVVSISETIAKEDKYDLVLPSTVPVVALGGDITTKVIAELDKKLPKVALGVDKVNISTTPKKKSGKETAANTKTEDKAKA